MSGLFKLRRQTCFAAVLLVVQVSLVGCLGSGVPPVSDRSGASVTDVSTSGRYVVVPGDTLYSIAWRHQRDFRDLATLNSIRRPYDIYPGQRLVIRTDHKPSRPARDKTVAVLKPSTTTKPHPFSVTQPKADGASKRATAAPSAQAVTQSKPRSSPAVTRLPQSKLESKPRTGPVVLRWPSNGRRLRGFGDQQVGAQMPSRSIDFILETGASIRAAEAGEVVYVGQGLAGYQQFVIVKHNDTWLSAYGFNATSRVREKQQLKQGAVLATLGRSSNGGARQRELHFEVRKNGEPVNPASVIKGSLSPQT